MSEDEDGLGIFQEPDGFYQPEKPYTYQEYPLSNGKRIKLRLVGHNPLWGHLLWNGGRVLSNYLEAHAEALVKDRNILELGAGAGLPSLVCAVHGARHAVVTDYPDAELIENLRHNISSCPHVPDPPNITAQGHLWGTDTAPLAAVVSDVDGNASNKITTTNVFDTVILADLLFNHHCHKSLLQTIQQSLSKSSSAKALVFFTPYRPWLLQADLAFFDQVKDPASNLTVKELGTWHMDKVMFDDDPGDEKLRRTVFGFEITWQLSFLGT